MNQDGNRTSRALSARSVVASVLLGTEPPQLAVRTLVRAAELFGIAEGTTRVAISRMVSAGELEACDDTSYRLSGHLLRRRARQEAGRHPGAGAWDGTWVIVAVASERRSAQERAALRTAMRQARMAELREGLWLRPANLGTKEHPPWSPDDVLGGSLEPDSPLRAHCLLMRGAVPVAQEHAELAGRLWDLDGWARGADSLRADMASAQVPLEAGELSALAPAFVLAAEVVRHLAEDPLLPAVMVAPDWPGDRLREDYDAFEAAFRSLLRRWDRLEGA
jgi:phenylacetic acid degradation operon negative regulatory protein